MRDVALYRITETGNVEWPWAAPAGLAIITGASGGGGGGGGAFCLEGLNLFGAGGGGGGGGGGATTLKVAGESHHAVGGNGGGGGGGGGLGDGQPLNGKNGTGCHYGCGGQGGTGAVATPADGRLVSNGGNGGRGFPGETLIVELKGLSRGDRFEVEIGRGGRGGGDGKGYEKGNTGDVGADGFVLLVPLHAGTEAPQC